MSGKRFGGTFGRELAVDLGTANTVVYVRGEGIVLDEPSVVAVNSKNKRLLAVGMQARRMTGRTPSHIHITRPLRDGVISDLDTCEKMLAYFIRRVNGSRRVAKPRMVICVPSGVTPVERRAVQEVAELAGARKPAFIIEEPTAAAIGAGLPVHEPTGNLVVDVGGGTTEVAASPWAGSLSAHLYASAATGWTKPSPSSSRRNTALPWVSAAPKRSRSPSDPRAPSKKSSTERFAAGIS